jgi:hypothetical protein
MPILLNNFDMDVCNSVLSFVAKKQNFLNYEYFKSKKIFINFSLVMASGIYAIANIGRFKVFVGDVNSVKLVWPTILEMLNTGTYPHAELQREWQQLGQQRHFTFHTQKEIAGNREIIGIEQMER